MVYTYNPRTKEVEGRRIRSSRPDPTTQQVQDPSRLLETLSQKTPPPPKAFFPVAKPA